MSKLKGEIKLGQDISNKNDYWIYDENGFICGSLGVNEDKVKELISIANHLHNRRIYYCTNPFFRQLIILKRIFASSY